LWQSVFFFKYVLYFHDYVSAGWLSQYNYYTSALQLQCYRCHYSWIVYNIILYQTLTWLKYIVIKNVLVIRVCHLSKQKKTYTHVPYFKYYILFSYQNRKYTLGSEQFKDIYRFGLYIWTSEVGTLI